MSGGIQRNAAGLVSRFFPPKEAELPARNVQLREGGLVWLVDGAAWGVISIINRIDEI